MRTWLRANRGFLLFVAGFLFFRTAVADWNPVPTGSMRPTILQGDVVLVDRLAYDWKVPLTNVSLHPVADPQRGDVVVFDSPADGSRLIKRIVAVPGDQIELRHDVLIINGQAATYGPAMPSQEWVAPGVEVPALRQVETLLGQARMVQHLPGIAARRDVAPITLGPDQFFMMGDNRDNSFDSRYLGPVERRLINGRARRVLVSADITDHWLPRWDRIGSRLQ
ncbi:signal peptidase I [Roseateles depolymerans]|uniref:Signal peptidase I n=2 Tax=Roseateles depolymerans TaxID=76731 RepID=A0A0U3LR98_9BURK|nr:signal peptidase I [Roseateles depolymerans]ALV07527.1 signal peptidase [Roseateles depolymerans]REG22257.1 signal peptidase I [Roseateles depolymerans]